MIGSAPNYTINTAWLNRVAEVVEFVRSAGMKAIINIHHDGADSYYWLSVRRADLSGSNKAAIDQKFTAVWRQISERFRDSGDFLIFEGFNELHDGNWGYPTRGTTRQDLNDQYERVNELNQIFVNTVRAAGGQNASRYLLIHGLVTRPSLTVQHLVMPRDTAVNRLIVGIHYYDPYDFSGSATQRVWGEKALPGNWANENHLRNTFDSVRDRFIKNGIPVIIGEYGAVNQSGAAFAHRLYYMEYVTKYAIDCRLIPFYWDNGGFGSGAEAFGLLNRRNGEPPNANAAAVLNVIMKAASEVYSMNSITAP
jgi:endoglucanase